MSAILDQVAEQALQLELCAPLLNDHRPAATKAVLDLEAWASMHSFEGTRADQVRVAERVATPKLLYAGVAHGEHLQCTRASTSL